MMDGAVHGLTVRTVPNWAPSGAMELARLAVKLSLHISPHDRYTRAMARRIRRAFEVCR